MFTVDSIVDTDIHDAIVLVTKLAQCVLWPNYNPAHYKQTLNQT